MRVQIKIRATAEEKQQIQARADHAGLSVSEYLVQAALRDPTSGSKAPMPGQKLTAMDAELLLLEADGGPPPRSQELYWVSARGFWWRVGMSTSGYRKAIAYTATYPWQRNARAADGRAAEGCRRWSLVKDLPGFEGLGAKGLTWAQGVCWRLEGYEVLTDEALIAKTKTAIELYGDEPPCTWDENKGRWEPITPRA